MKTRILLPVVLLVAGLLAAAGAMNLIPELGAAPSERFPHASHEGLFPDGCVTCHGGIGDEGGAAYTVAGSDCAECHDGDVLPAMDWSPPSARRASLEFDHAMHVGGMEMDCATCHAAEGGSGEWEVVRVQTAVCWNCHESEEHWDGEADCATCHVALTEAVDMSAEWVAAMPRPESHADPQFLHEHGIAARASLDDCAVCHAQESCTRCHFNVDRVDVIGQLGSDPRVLELSGEKAGYWPVPDTHLDPDWVLAGHAELAMEIIQRCSNCHTQPSCTQCHAQAVPAVVYELPLPGPDEPQGVQLPHAPPPGHPPGFRTEHGGAAMAETPKCAACHTESSCDDCHQAQIEPGFHPVNYVMRHAADAFAQDPDCASCHSHEVFCRGCHIEGGLSSTNSINGSFHDAQPFWLLSHGRAARQGMDTCVGCHQQSDCLECHSAKGGWRVSPHGDGFDADDMWEKNPTMCRTCHLGEPR